MKTSLAIALLLLADAALAQATHEGTFAVAAVDSSGARREATLTLKGEGGSYMNYPRNNVEQRNPCLSKELPVRVISAGADELVFVVEASKAFTGCVDYRFVLKPVEGGGYEGRLGRSGSATLTRK